MFKIQCKITDNNRNVQFSWCCCCCSCCIQMTKHMYVSWCISIRIRTHTHTHLICCGHDALNLTHTPRCTASLDIVIRVIMLRVRGSLAHPYITTFIAKLRTRTQIHRYTIIHYNYLVCLTHSLQSLSPWLLAFFFLPVCLSVCLPRVNHYEIAVFCLAFLSSSFAHIIV